VLVPWRRAFSALRSESESLVQTVGDARPSEWFSADSFCRPGIFSRREQARVGVTHYEGMRMFPRIRVAFDKIGGKSGLPSVRRKRQRDSIVRRLFQRKDAKHAENRKEIQTCPDRPGMDRIVAPCAFEVSSSLRFLANFAALR